MTERLDAVVAREYQDRNGDRKTSFTRIGVAFPMRNGGYSIVLEALPVPQMGERGIETRILLMPPRQRDDRQSQPDHSDAGLDDEIPF